MRVVGHHGGPGRIEYLDIVLFQALVEARGGVPDQFRQALAVQQPTVPGLVDGSDEPFFVPDDDNRARGDVDSRHAPPSMIGHAIAISLLVSIGHSHSSRHRPAAWQKMKLMAICQYGATGRGHA